MTSTNISKLTRRSALATLAGGLLAGCAVLSGPVSPQLYVLRPTTPGAAGAKLRWQLSVGMPDAADSIDTARIALTRSSTTLDYYAAAAWTDRVPLMMQHLLVAAYEDGNRLTAVDKDTSGFETDYLLETTIRDFQARYDSAEGAPKVVVGIQAKLVKMPQRQIINSLAVHQEASASANTVDSVVAAFNQATGAAVTQIVNWTYTAVPA